MEEILEELNQSPWMIGSMIVGKDGLVIVKNWTKEIDADFIGAAVADLFTSAESIVDEKLEHGEMGLISIESSEGKFFLYNINEVTFLVAATLPRANLGMVRLEIKAAAEKLKEVL